MQMCWQPHSEAREENVMCFEWQVEVSHTNTVGLNDISAWQSRQPGEGDRKNVSMQTNGRMYLIVQSENSANLIWFISFVKCKTITLVSEYLNKHLTLFYFSQIILTKLLVLLLCLAKILLFFSVDLQF